MQLIRSGNLPKKTWSEFEKELDGDDMNGTAKFSVIIRTKDRHDVIKRAVQSALNQSYPPHEVIVVNDGGKKVGNVLRGLDVTILNTKGVGKGEAANYGVSKSSGTHICFLDDDDYWMEDHLLTLSENLVKDIGYTHTKVQKQDGGEYVHKWDYSESEVALGWRSPIICSVAFSREAWDRVGGFDTKMKQVCDDWDLYLRLSKYYDFQEIPEVTAVYNFPTVHKAAARGNLMMDAWRYMHKKDPERTYELTSEQASEIARKLIWYEQQLVRLNVYLQFLYGGQGVPVILRNDGQPNKGNEGIRVSKSGE